LKSTPRPAPTWPTRSAGRSLRSWCVMQFIPGRGLDNVIEEVKRLTSATSTSARGVAPSPESAESPGGITPTAAGIARSLLTERFGSTQPIAGEPSSIEASRSDVLAMRFHSPRPLVGSADLSSEVVLGTTRLSSVTGSADRYWRCVARRPAPDSHRYGRRPRHDARHQLRRLHRYLVPSLFQPDQKSSDQRPVLDSELCEPRDDH
jgi:hypothetical protein